MYEHCRFDVHWRPFYLHCQFCAIDYDVITHLETISYEAPFVLSRIAGKMSSMELETQYSQETGLKTYTRIFSLEVKMVEILTDLNWK